MNPTTNFAFLSNVEGACAPFGNAQPVDITIDNLREMKAGDIMMVVAVTDMMVMAEAERIGEKMYEAMGVDHEAEDFDADNPENNWRSMLLQREVDSSDMSDPAVVATLAARWSAQYRNDMVHDMKIRALRLLAEATKARKAPDFKQGMEELSVHNFEMQLKAIALVESLVV